ncbi:MAG: 1,2-phenylacetyl-CoA epoxidase subunit PaaC [Rhodothalassiaceae bacterium]
MPDVLQGQDLDYALRLGDSALILGQRLCEWVGHAPALELEMAVSNLALDLIGEAQLFLEHAAALKGNGSRADGLAFGRDVLDFRNLLIVEQPNGDWAMTIARHFLFSVFHRLQAAALAEGGEESLAGIATKTGPEIAYHERFSRDWMLRLGDGTEESHDRLQAAVDRLWKFTGEMFEVDALEELLIAEGRAIDARMLEAPWREAVTSVFAEAGLSVPSVSRMTSGGRRGHHSEHLGHILSELQFLQRTYPGLEW